MQRKRRVLLLLMAMSPTFAICWLPLTLVNVAHDFGLHFPWGLGLGFEYYFFFHRIVHLLACSSVVWNPLLYYWMSKVSSS